MITFIIYIIGYFASVFMIRRINKYIAKGIVHSYWYTKFDIMIMISSLSWVMVITCIYVLIEEKCKFKERL